MKCEKEPTGDDIDKEKDISNSSKDMLVDIPSSDAYKACGSEQSLSFQDLPFDIFSIISTYLPNKDLVGLARTCHRNEDWTLDDLKKRKASAALLAVVQGNKAKLKSMLEINPNLLYLTEGKATDYSGRLIQDLTPFQAALCNGDIEICEMMKENCFSQLENGQAEMKMQFNVIFPYGVEAHVKMQQENVFDFNEILQAIIDAQDHEVTAALNKAFDNNLLLHRTLENFREAYTEKSLSEIVFNPYHLLRAFKMYNANFDILGNWDKRNLFWRQIIGFAQRYLPACYLQTLAQGIYFVVKEKEPLQRSFKFKGGDGSIFPSAGFSGLGFDFAAGASARALTSVVRLGLLLCFLEIMCQEKISSLEKLLSPIQRCMHEPCKY